MKSDHLTRYWFAIAFVGLAVFKPKDLHDPFGVMCFIGFVMTLADFVEWKTK